MSDVPTLSAAIIATNEERNLAELLPQLGWVDEIVLVDGGSKDQTPSVAREYGCRVAVRTFAAQRNHAIRLVTADWVLSIDADERPTRRLIAEVLERIRFARHSGYRVPIRSSIFGRPMRGCGTQDDCPLRLFRRRSACWVGDVHEVLRVSGPVGRLHGSLEHQTLPDLHAFLAKMHRYTLLEAQSRVAAGRPPRRHARWIAPAAEVFRRLIWKRGLLDGPEGWAFCLLSGLSEWVLADRHRRLWQSERRRVSECSWIRENSAGRAKRRLNSCEFSYDSAAIQTSTTTTHP